MAFKILFVGDSWETLDKPKDSSVFLARIAIQNFKCQVFWATPDRIFWENGHFFARPNGEIAGDGRLISVQSIKPTPLAAYHSVHLRSDPPVSDFLVRFWQLLIPAEQNLKIKFVNSPKGLLLWNEKLSTLRFNKATIPGIYTNSRTEFRRFFEANKKEGLVLKPLTNAASRGVTLLSESWSEAEKAFEELRANNGAWVGVQKVEKRISREGETRAFLLAGKLIASVNKRPSNGVILQHDSSNPPLLKRTTLTAKQKSLSIQIGKLLRNDGIYFASIDFIGGRVLEINVTSTGMVQWLDAALASDSKKKSFSNLYWHGLI